MTSRSSRPAWFDDRGAALPDAVPARRRPLTEHSADDLCRDLRREVLRHFGDRGDPMLTPAALNTLETNSTLAWERSAALLTQLATVSGAPRVSDSRLLDLGCGFGALSVVFAALGADVTAVDPNAERFDVGATVAARHGLRIRWIQSSMERLPPDLVGFDIAIVNNSVCYVVDLSLRQAAFDRLARALRPGGAAVLREPNRIALLDQFTRVPFLGLVPPDPATRLARLLGRPRSRVRLQTRRHLAHELRSAGLRPVRTRSERRIYGLPLPPRYIHVVAIRP